MASKKAEEERLANQQKMDELNKKMEDELARNIAEEKRREEERLKASQEAAEKKKEQIRQAKASGLTIKSTGGSTNKRKKKGKLSKAAKQFGSSRRVKF